MWWDRFLSFFCTTPGIYRVTDWPCNTSLLSLHSCLISPSPFLRSPPPLLHLLTRCSVLLWLHDGRAEAERRLDLFYSWKPNHCNLRCLQETNLVLWPQHKFIWADENTPQPELWAAEQMEGIREGKQTPSTRQRSLAEAFQHGQQYPGSLCWSESKI